MQPVTLSANAVAVLRFEIRGRKARNPAGRLPAYRELADAGIMELVPGSDGEYRFTEEGSARREAILREQEERIERERHEPPDARNLSDAARELLRRIAAGDRVEVTVENRPVFRELAAAHIIYLMHTFAKGDESGYRFTYWGWKQRFEMLGCCEGEAERQGSGDRNLELRVSRSGSSEPESRLMRPPGEMPPPSRSWAWNALPARPCAWSAEPIRSLWMPIASM